MVHQETGLNRGAMAASCGASRRHGFKRANLSSSSTRPLPATVQSTGQLLEGKTGRAIDTGRRRVVRMAMQSDVARHDDGAGWRCPKRIGVQHVGSACLGRLRSASPRLVSSHRPSPTFRLLFCRNLLYFAPSWVGSARSSHHIAVSIPSSVSPQFSRPHAGAVARCAPARSSAAQTRYRGTQK